MIALCKQNLKFYCFRSFVARLPDKGEKIWKLKQEIEEELKERETNQNVNLIEQLDLKADQIRKTRSHFRVWYILYV